MQYKYKYENERMINMILIELKYFIILASLCLTVNCITFHIYSITISTYFIKYIDSLKKDAY